MAIFLVPTRWRGMNALTTRRHRVTHTDWTLARSEWVGTALEPFPDHYHPRLAAGIPKRSKGFVRARINGN